MKENVEQLDSKLLNKQLKAKKHQKEVLNFQSKKLIAESLVKSNNRNCEMNALLNTSTTDSIKPGSTNNLGEPNSTSHKIPSYIGISCAISGYSTYSNRLSFINSNDSNSPSSIKRLDDPNLNQSKINHQNATDTKIKCPGQFLDTSRNIESYNSFKNNLNRFNKLSNHVGNNNSSHKNRPNTNHLTNHLTNQLNSLNISNNQPNQFDSFDSSFLSKDRCNDSTQSRDEDGNKSLVQKRIESLYGQNFASNWKDRHGKSRFRENEKINIRPPSCPPEFITNGFISSKSK